MLCNLSIVRKAVPQQCYSARHQRARHGGTSRHPDRQGPNRTARRNKSRCKKKQGRSRSTDVFQAFGEKSTARLAQKPTRISTTHLEYVHMAAVFRPFRKHKKNHRDPESCPVGRKLPATSTPFNFAPQTHAQQPNTQKYTSSHGCSSGPVYISRYRRTTTDRNILTPSPPSPAGQSAATTQV